MITDSQANTVYFSNFLREGDYKSDFQRIRLILEKHSFNYKFLNGTKDIWCRDYMPIQVDKDTFIQFRYEPWYLDDDTDYRSSPKNIIKKNDLPDFTFSDINLDGGNVVRSEDAVILSRRIFAENPTVDEEELVKELTRLFGVKVILIPDLDKKTDMTGHADGYVRFIDDNRVLVNSFHPDEEEWNNGFKKALAEHNLDYVEMPWYEDSKKDSALGIYVNYLEIGDVIIFPIFNNVKAKNDEALSIMYREFPEKKIEPVLIEKIGIGGGLLNCVSWTVFE